MDVTGFSLENVFGLRGRTFAEIRRHTAAIDSLAAAIADVDAALQTSIDCRSIDDQQTLVTSARRLAAILDGGQA